MGNLWWGGIGDSELETMVRKTWRSATAVGQHVWNYGDDSSRHVSVGGLGRSEWRKHDWGADTRSSGTHSGCAREFSGAWCERGVAHRGSGTCPGLSQSR